MELIRNEKVAENTVEVEFKVSAEQFNEAISKVFRKTSKDMTIPGFRKGKAPRNMVEKLYGEEVFFNDAIDELLPTAYVEAVEKAGITPVAQPQIEVTECTKEAGFTVKATITTYPEVKIGEYKGIKAQRNTIEVTEEVIQDQLQMMRERNARLVAVEGRSAEMTDTANIDFEGFVDGVAFEGGKGEGFDLVLGSNQFIPGFEAQIVGKNEGEEFDVVVTFPEEYQATELAGKEAVFKTKLNKITAKELPELDDEFAKDVSEFDSLEELKNDIKSKREAEAKQAAELDVENKIVEQVVATLEANVPEAMNEARVDEMVRDFEGRLQQQGLQLEVYLQYTQSDMETFRKTFKDQAEQQVKIRLALEKIAELEGITASDEDLEKELTRISELYHIPLDNVKQMVPANEIKKDLAIQKAIDFIKENAEITNA